MLYVGKSVMLKGNRKTGVVLGRVLVVLSVMSDMFDGRVAVLRSVISDMFF